MRKIFPKKELASALALAMVVTSLAVPTSASAASTTKVVKQGGAAAPTILYVGDKGTDYGLSKLYAGNKYTWTISDSAIANINKAGVVTAKTPGTVTIKATARNSKGKWLNAFTHKIKVNLRVSSIDIGADDFTLVMGQEKDLNAVKTPANSTDVLKYVSSNPEVATVDAKTGVIKTVGYGDATITVLAKATFSSADSSKYNRKDTVKVTVVSESTGSTSTSAGGSSGGNSGGSTTKPQPGVPITIEGDGDVYRLPYDYREVESVKVTHGGFDYEVNSDTLNALTYFVDNAPATYNTWKTITNASTQPYQGVTATVSAEEAGDIKTVSFTGGDLDGKVYTVELTQEGKVTVTTGSGIEYQIDKRYNNSLTITNAPDDLVFEVTY